MTPEQTYTRLGRFTSSELACLVADGKKKGELSASALTYIQEKRLERKFKCSLNDEARAFNLDWGHLVERYVYQNCFGIEWKLTSDHTFEHPDCPDHWAGSPDCITRAKDRVADIKCPTSRKSFLTFADCKDIHEAIERHKDAIGYFWQLVSNACITGASCAELHLFMPHKADLDKIRIMALGTDYEWIGRMERLPFLPDHVVNHVMIEWDVTQELKQQLTDRVVAAVEKLEGI